MRLPPCRCDYDTVIKRIFAVRQSIVANNVMGHSLPKGRCVSAPNVLCAAKRSNELFARQQLKLATRYIRSAGIAIFFSASLTSRLACCNFGRISSTRLATRQSTRDVSGRNFWSRMCSISIKNGSQ